MADDLLDTMSRETLGDHIGQLLGIAIHRAVEDDSTWLTSEAGESLVESERLTEALLRPYDTVCGTDEVYV